MDGTARTKENIIGAIERVTAKYDTHYTNHLRRAIDVIGKENLIEFVKNYK